MNNDSVRSPDGSGYSAEPEPEEVSAVPVSIPNAYPYMEADDFQRGSISERKAISSFLVFCAARAAHRWTQAPWWHVRTRLRGQWSMTALTVCAEQIERGDHLQDQASWLSETHGGQLIYDGIASAIEARSDATTQIGAAEGESAASEAGDAPTVEVRP